MRRPGKTANVLQEMESMGLEVMGIAETSGEEKMISRVHYQLEIHTESSAAEEKLIEKE